MALSERMERMNERVQDGWTDLILPTRLLCQRRDRWHSRPPPPGGEMKIQTGAAVSLLKPHRSIRLTHSLGLNHKLLLLVFFFCVFLGEWDSWENVGVMTLRYKV